MKNLGFALYSVCGLVAAFLLSWVLLAQINFGYSALYEVMSIEQHVKKFGPQNRYRRAFHYTDKPEHVRLFAAINDAIHNQGNGLDDLKYHTPQGQEIDTLLREPEVIHLVDVANLITAFFIVGGAAALIWFMTTFICLMRKIALPSVKVQSISIAVLMAVAALITLVVGPVKVFYAFHVWLFPDNHQWFFYYQESLMTILMKAPFLFGYIAILLAVLALLIFILVNLALQRMTKHRMASQDDANREAPANAA